MARLVRPTCVDRVWVTAMLLLLTGCFATGPQTVVVERIDYQPPVEKKEEVLADDVFTAAPEFDPQRVHSQDADGWTVNLSGAVTTLDLEMLKPDRDEELLRLRANYRDAIQSGNRTVLPSVNLIDGKAKQFDDGVYAALEQFWFQGRVDDFAGDLNLLARLGKAVPQDSPAAAFFAAGLELAGIEIPATDQSAKAKFKTAFEAELINTKPIGFYAWNDKLQQCYRVGRFFQTDFNMGDARLQPIIDALRQDSELHEQYRRVLARWARFSNAASRFTVLDLVEHASPDELEQLGNSRGLSVRKASLLPPGTNRESELTRRLFPLGFPADADIMRELVKAIRSGAVDLQPTDKSGWYDYQVYALETLLVPKRGLEADRMLLSANYKRRMLEAFQALMTKRKETHILRSEVAAKAAAAPPPLKSFKPRLRLEPAPTYFLRMARSYRFLDAAVREFVPDKQLAELHGLKEHDRRSQPLLTELADMQQLFYGFYALSAEDIGLEINVTDDEQSQLEQGRIRAAQWLADFAIDDDLAADTRVIVPVAEDVGRGAMSTWATVGVRFARLKASYRPDAPPRVRPADMDEWTALNAEQLSPATYLICVDEFVSVQVPKSRILTRAEFRSLCDESANREEVIKRLQQ